jgi:hypothetical protein
MDTLFVGWGGLALINAALANIDRRGPLKHHHHAGGHPRGNPLAHCGR